MRQCLAAGGDGAIGINFYSNRRQWPLGWSLQDGSIVKRVKVGGVARADDLLQPGIVMAGDALMRA